MAPDGADAQGGVVAGLPVDEPVVALVPLDAHRVVRADVDDPRVEVVGVQVRSTQDHPLQRFSNEHFHRVGIGVRVTQIQVFNITILKNVH